MKKYILTIAAALLTSNAFAISDVDLTNKCLETGKAKITAQAESWGCPVDLDQVTVQSIDNRFFNPSKYVWYQALSPCANGFDRVIKLVQYANGKCF